MYLINQFFLFGHYFLLFVLCLFGLHRLSMVWRWSRMNPKSEQFDHVKSAGELPTITVQIPLYNEQFVAERIIDACAELNYPSDLLQIQIVDDSDDETVSIVAQRVAYHCMQGVNIQHVRRQQRQGFKAGALKDAMESAEGEFIAIFDADFVPSRDCLIQSIGSFKEPQLAMIQFRWEHLNRRSSELTETQAIMLDAHFALEQQVRSQTGMLFNFNGTAGIWRKEAIIDAGNWSADTLTEDLDLSYRVQLKGWKMQYRNDIACPGEIPADMNAFKSQQHRWAKGGIQVMKKMLLRVWQAPLSLSKKIEASFHLSNNLAYLVMLTDTLIFLIPSLWIRTEYDVANVFWVDVPLLLMSSGGHLLYLYWGQIALGHSRWKALLRIPGMMVLAVQLATNNARAGIEALMGQQSAFIRTPKSGELAGEQAKSKVKRTLLPYKAVAPKGAICEMLLAIIYFIVMIWALSQQHWFMVPFVCLLTVGFCSTALMSFHHQLRLNRK